MNIDDVINKMDDWLEKYCPEGEAVKIAGDNIATMHDLQFGSQEEIAHLRYMIKTMKEMPSESPKEIEKLMRWLGFMQGAMWSLGFASLDEFRAMNRREE